ncbi:MAG: cellulase family glycosylhydrolase [Candidatus Heimdallarchaeota archaeon]|nr:cellulase family glycosylhydrolase [Candidatus Heimdallarchaeota archaeon]MCK4290660.1 cellulase family glycosylhydrolase [Candidatus Heimdallarchaeota archaeon]
MTLRIKDDTFRDEKGRSVLLRGVNLGGSTKVPVTPDGATHIKTDFSDHKDVSFIGHPFPLDEADEHFSRLKNWGFNCLRFLTTWEAIEHKGPGKYDREYLKYLRKLLEKANDYDLYCFIDPHQDVWSRMTGGDGAPGWTLEKVGLDYTKFTETEAALLMQEKYPNDYPQMIWSSNYFRFATSTMFTLFFGGNDFAPGFKIGKKTIQDYLQEHFINSMKEVAKNCRELPNVIGFDIWNEPNNGFIGMADLNHSNDRDWGLRFTGFEAIATASGYPMKIPYYEIKGVSMKQTDSRLVNPNGVSCWLPDAKDIWRELGIYKEDSKGKPKLVKPNYFSKGGQTNFFWNHIKPFINNYAKAIRTIDTDAIIFIETDPFELIFNANTHIQESKYKWTKKDAKDIVNASHWYDGITLYLRRFMKHFNLDTQTSKPYFFYKNIRNLFIKQLANIKKFSQLLGNCPTLIGEFGIPFNMYNKKAFRNGNWQKQIDAITLHLECMDANLLNFTMWNYTADNSNEWGDLWNMEDLSIFSRDQQTNPEDINSGGRAVEGFCRPFARNITGRLLSMSFNRRKKHFVLEYENNPKIKAPSKIYVPNIQYPNDYLVTAPGSRYVKDRNEQILEVYFKSKGIHRIEIKGK